jgi:hypothetical protein
VFGSGIRRLDGEAVGGRRLARTPPRRVTRWLATSIIAPPAPALSSTGDELPSPIELADWRAGRNAIYRFAALTIGARLAIADA